MLTHNDDTGGTKRSEARHMVEAAMESGFDHRHILFLYNPRDVIRKFGEYYSQFFRIARQVKGMVGGIVHARLKTEPN